MSQKKDVGNDLLGQEQQSDIEMVINNEFCQENGIADLVLVIEDVEIPVCKSVLCIASPVFRAMLEGHFREKTETEIPLPGKRYDDFVEFLRCIYPDRLEEITERNVYMLLPLAHEYDVKKLLKKSQNLLVQVVKNRHTKDITQLYRHIHLSEMYSLEELKDKCIYLASEYTLKQFKAARTKYDISDASHLKIVELALRRHELNKSDDNEITQNIHVSTDMFMGKYMHVNLQKIFIDENNAMRILRLVDRFKSEKENKDYDVRSIVIKSCQRYYDRIKISEEFNLLPESIKSDLQYST